jgi:hypothetical protein
VVSATVTLLALHLGGTSVPSFATALLLVELFCHLANLDDGLRSASISAVAVLAARRRANFGLLRAPIPKSRYFSTFS